AQTQQDTFVRRLDDGDVDEEFRLSKKATKKDTQNTLAATAGPSSESQTAARAPEGQPRKVAETSRSDVRNVSFGVKSRPLKVAMIKPKKPAAASTDTSGAIASAAEKKIAVANEDKPGSDDGGGGLGGLLGAYGSDSDGSN
ncbi:hypothetical protein CYMTET_27533, partial [Cymbomonas tetramitiformis]